MSNPIDNSGYSILNDFATRCLISESNVPLITDMHIIANGNCFFHALGYANHYINSDNPELNNAVNKEINDDTHPSFSSNHKAIVGMYKDVLDINLLLNSPESPEDKVKIDTASNIIRVNVAEIILTITDQKNTNGTLNANGIINFDKRLNYTMFIKNLAGPRDAPSYNYSDHMCLYAASMYLNKILLIVRCNFDFKIEKYNIYQYDIIGPKKMVCTTNNVLVLINSGEHFETFYPNDYKSTKYSLNPGFVKLLNDDITIIRPQYDNVMNNEDQNSRIFRRDKMKEFIDVIDHYEFSINDLNINTLQQGAQPPLNTLTIKPEPTYEEIQEDTKFVEQDFSDIIKVHINNDTTDPKVKDAEGKKLQIINMLLNLQEKYKYIDNINISKHIQDLLSILLNTPPPSPPSPSPSLSPPPLLPSSPPSTSKPSPSLSPPLSLSTSTELPSPLLSPSPALLLSLSTSTELPSPLPSPPQPSTSKLPLPPLPSPPAPPPLPHNVPPLSLKKTRRILKLQGDKTPNTSVIMYTKRTTFNPLKLNVTSKLPTNVIVYTPRARTRRILILPT